MVLTLRGPMVRRCSPEFNVARVPNRPYLRALVAHHDPPVFASLGVWRLVMMDGLTNFGTNTHPGADGRLNPVGPESVRPLGRS